MGRYAFNQLLRSWNRNAKPEAKITTKSGYEALKDEARQAHAEKGTAISKCAVTSQKRETLSFWIFEIQWAGETRP